MADAAGDRLVLVEDLVLVDADVGTQAQILDLLKALKERLQMTLILISHNLDFLSQLTGQIYTLADGRILKTGGKAIKNVTGYNLGQLLVGSEGTLAVVTKIILENTYLTDEEKRLACRISRDEGATFVKTSTGFGGGGATVEDVALMRETVGPEMGVKASGGIKDYADAKRMIEAGASRIGASASVAIIQDAAQVSLSA